MACARGKALAQCRGPREASVQNEGAFPVLKSLPTRFPLGKNRPQGCNNIHPWHLHPARLSPRLASLAPRLRRVGQGGCHRAPAPGLRGHRLRPLRRCRRWCCYVRRTAWPYLAMVREFRLSPESRRRWPCQKARSACSVNRSAEATAAWASPWRREIPLTKPASAPAPWLRPSRSRWADTAVF